MKKVFFTAIAMIAFSSASMANTIADEEVVTEEKKEVLVKKSSCQLVSETAYNYAVYEECQTEEDAADYANLVYVICILSSINF